MKQKLKKTSYWISVSVVGIMVGVSLQLVGAAWTPPPADPPNSNVGAPLTTGAASQTKNGQLVISHNQFVDGIISQTPSAVSFTGEGPIAFYSNVGSNTSFQANGYGRGININSSNSIGVSDYAPRSFHYGNLAVGTSQTNSTGLKLDVHGNVGADYYCDRNGSNCTSAANLGGGGCNWSGWKCACTHDISGTEGRFIMGIQCLSGSVNDLRVTDLYITSSNAACPGTAPVWCNAGYSIN